jgi:hypothetical protein
LDPEFTQTRAQRIGVDSQNQRRPFRSFDAPVRLMQDIANVGFLDLPEAICYRRIGTYPTLDFRPPFVLMKLPSLFQPCGNWSVGPLAMMAARPINVFQFAHIAKPAILP